MKKILYKLIRQRRKPAAAFRKQKDQLQEVQSSLSINKLVIYTTFDYGKLTLETKTLREKYLMQLLMLPLITKSGSRNIQILQEELPRNFDTTCVCNVICSHQG